MVFSFVVFYVFLVCFEEGIWWGKKEEKAKKGKHTVMETVDVRLLVRYCMVRCELFQHWSNASAASICAWTGNCAPPPPHPKNVTLKICTDFVYPNPSVLVIYVG